MEKIIGLFIVALAIAAMTVPGSCQVNIEYPVCGDDVVDNSGSMNAEDLLDIITIYIIGEVIRVDDLWNVFEGKITVGQKINGFYKYNDRTQDSIPEPYSGYYCHFIRPYGFTVNVGDFVFCTDPNDVYFCINIVNDFEDVYHQRTEDSYIVNSHRNLPLSNGVAVESIYWWLVDYTGTAFTSDALPSTPPNLADFEATSWHLSLSKSYFHGDPDYTYFINCKVTRADTSMPPNPPGIGGYDNRFAGPYFPIGFKMFAEDPDLHPIRYGIDWGDGTMDWTDYIESGTLVDVSHIYSQPGVYTVKVMAEDEFGLQSQWSDTKTVRVFTGGGVLDWFINFLFPL